MNEDPRIDTPQDDEQRLRGADLTGAEQDSAADHEAHLKRRRPDAELRLDGETDELYQDGLEIDDDDETLAGTRGGGSAGAKG
jgi:hypothetical protein